MPPKPTNVQNANLVRRREVASDKFYTPETLARLHLSTLQSNEKILVYEPFRGRGSYYNLFPEYFPNALYDWSEIDEGRDFFNYCGTADIIVTNPPFSILKEVIERLIQIRPIVISLLLNMYAVTPCRIKQFNNAGYFVTGYHLTRVNRWFGVSVIVTFSREATQNIISFDCTKHILESES